MEIVLDKGKIDNKLQEKIAEQIHQQFSKLFKEVYKIQTKNKNNPMEYSQAMTINLLHLYNFLSENPLDLATHILTHLYQIKKSKTALSPEEAISLNKKQDYFG